MTDSSKTNRRPFEGYGSYHDTRGLTPHVETLLAMLEQEYFSLLARLSKRLMSAEAAADALHDAYVKLHSVPDITKVRQPRAYLYRMALNLALNRRRNDGRAIPVALHELETIPDGSPDPERAALARREMEQMFAALHSLPSKSRAIFLARWRDEKTNEEIATAFEMHKRSVQKDLARTELKLRKVLERFKMG